MLSKELTIKLLSNLLNSQVYAYVLSTRQKSK